MLSPSRRLRAPFSLLFTHFSSRSSPSSFILTLFLEKKEPTLVSTRLLLGAPPLALLLSKKIHPSLISFKKTLTLARSARGLTTATLPPLSYEYEALEPVISGEIVRLHHLKHHLTYVTNYNTALELLDSAMEKGDASAIVGLQSAIKFNGGGHVNHSIFWKNLKPISAGGGEPSHMKLGWQIDTDFGSFEALISKMNAEGAALQGSSRVWLAFDKELTIKRSQNLWLIIFVVVICKEQKIKKERKEKDKRGR